MHFKFNECHLDTNHVVIASLETNLSSVIRLAIWCDERAT
jgi:hypothetical protein